MIELTAVIEIVLRSALSEYIRIREVDIMMSGDQLVGSFPQQHHISIDK